MFKNVLDAFLIIWEILCCKFLLESFLTKRKNSNKIITFGILMMLSGINYMFTYFFSSYLWLKLIACITATSVAMYFLFECRYFKAFGLTVLYWGLGTLIEYLAILAFSTMFPSISELTQNTSMLMVLSFGCKVAELFVILILKRHLGHKSSDILTKGEWVKLLTIPVITILILMVIIQKYGVWPNVEQDYVPLYVALGLAGMNIIIFCIINDLLEREMTIRNEKLMREKVKNETAMYYSVSENLEKHRKRTHEFKNQLACIAALAGEGDIDKLNDYISKLDSELKLRMDMVDTNNVIVNAILNTKYREALEQGMLFVVKVNDLSDIVLSDMDVVVILSNLLNNALEACTECENKVIKLKFVLEDGQIAISVKNSFSKLPVKEHERFLTGKATPEDHGIGIQNIIEVIERYKGHYVIDYGEGIFSFSILIPNK